MIASFAPVVPAAPRVLVLGSIPGVRSLQSQQYYAHPQNQFWRLMASVLDEALPSDYGDRLAMLARHGVALWDVLASCEREGSLDAAIRGEQPNAIEGLLEHYPSINTVALNGRKAGSSFRKHITPLRPVTLLDLPSSSAANARLRFEQKCEQWCGMRAALGGGIG